MKRMHFVAVASFLAVVLFGFVDVVHASNTYSVDLELGSSQYLSHTDTSVFDITGDMTIEAWVKLETAQSATVQTIVSKYLSAGNQRGYTAQVDKSGSNFRVKFIISNDGTSGYQRTINYELVVGTWYHVALVYTAASQQVEFFVNGVSQGTGSGDTLPTSIYNNTAPFYVGAYQSGDLSEWDGLIDEVRIWNVARTSTQIANNYNIELVGNESGLQGYWKLNNNLNDETVNGNNLTNNNSAIFSTDVPSFAAELLKARKSSDESVTSSTTLQNDDELKLTLAANKTYTIDAVIFATSASSNPDFKIAFTVPSGATMTLGYIAASPSNLLTQGELLSSSGTASQVIPLRANASAVVLVKGTVVIASTGGDLTLQWAQFTSNATATVVKAGSYIRADLF
ncbi:MAG: LamG domain-containing protein [Candidatus Yanofskybacteria bacterium]|nr:LamG domain-containing protein [Candidatus Yanofskybacteria bacterium]